MTVSEFPLTLKLFFLYDGVSNMGRTWILKLGSVYLFLSCKSCTRVQRFKYPMLQSIKIVIFKQYYPFSWVLNCHLYIIPVYFGRFFKEIYVKDKHCINIRSSKFSNVQSWTTLLICAICDIISKFFFL